MAFLMKVNNIKKELATLDTLLKDSIGLFPKEGINDEDIFQMLKDLDTNIAPLSKKLHSWLEDKQSRIEELEFLTAGFRLEYGSVLEYRKFASMIRNKDIKRKLLEFGGEEIKHVDEFSKIIHEYGGEPEYTFVAENKVPDIDTKNLFDHFIKQEKAAVSYYQKGEERFQNSGFAWLLGKIKLEEKEHLKKLEELKSEYEEKEITLSVDPDFKWIDPMLGEPGDRAWIE